MRSDSFISHFARKQFNTLAQNETASSSKIISLPGLVRGNGTDLSNTDQLQKWAKKKLICNSFIIPLVDVAKSKGAFERAESYWNTFHCIRNLTSGDGRLHGEYCKNRFCPVCCGIRKAEIMNQYLPVIKKWEDPFFLTLTVKSPSAENLKHRIDDMFALIRRIIAKYRKRSNRRGSLRLVGVKSFECNYNIKENTYNPHFHLILPNKEIAVALYDEWLREGRKLWGQKAISQAGQCNKRIPNGDVEGCLVEILKYSSKIFTSPDVEQKKRGKNSPVVICIDAYDNIIAAMKKRRIFDRFGFNLLSREQKECKRKLLMHYKEWVYFSEYSDWIEIDGSNILSGYTAHDELRMLLKKSILKS